MNNLKKDSNISYWDNFYKSINDSEPVYDLWLDKYTDILEKSRDKEIIDLGCGSGSDTRYLFERNFKVVACDYSKEALKIISKHYDNVKILEINLENRLPFNNDYAEIIIADLSLHYFDDATTKKILLELKRVLSKDGYLIARVNTINDINYNAGCGEKLEKNLYLTKDGMKRFFDVEDIKKYFGAFKILKMEETIMNRYGADKYCFEILCQNNK
ncbi:class I SAM-dependent methyltransferase [Clostridium sp. SM-530-WT-3G]|uniref:class I SAM-dependent methyltransferase n=1 Tax=Clostridium sp. SM-530-WT-3G TaxID=2725303 RepID=UPI00145E5BF9|nr:class I SAM-dependent methyltransferase [Clostridium sp. SM-530-WT-3G]NME81566.1 class I SAM-dependent methyltransferase [Clostridium sp. SM-530-WT-3G]